MIWWLWNVWWYQQTVDVHSALHRCCYLVLTMCWRQWHLCRSSPPITDLWGADHKQGCQLSPRHWAPDQADRALWTLRHVLGWAGGSGAAAYISQYALFPSSPVVIRYNTDIAFWITYHNFIACKRRVNRVIRIFIISIGSTTTYNNNETLFFPFGLYCLHCTFENGANRTTIICTHTIIFLFCGIVFYLQLLCNGCAFIINCTQIICCWVRWCTKWQDGCIVLSAHPASPLPHQVWCVTYKPLELQTKVREDSQSRRRLTLGPSPGWKHLLVLSHIIHYKDTMLNGHLSVLNLKALIGAFNQEKALVWAFSLLAFSVIVKSSRTLVWSSSIVYTPLLLRMPPVPAGGGGEQWARDSLQVTSSQGWVRHWRWGRGLYSDLQNSLHWGEKTKNISPVSQHCWPKRPDSRWSNHNSFSCKGSL